RQLIARNLAVLVGVEGVQRRARWRVGTGPVTSAAQTSGRTTAAEELIHAGHALGFFLRQEAVLVDVEIAEQVVDQVVPPGLDRLAVALHVQAYQHRPRLTEEDELLHVGWTRRFRSRLRGVGGEGHTTQDQREKSRPHASTSRIGLAVGSTMRMGRPTLE